MIGFRRTSALFGVLACLPAVALAQAVTTSTVTFQQGTAGYSGAVDRQINMTGGTSSRVTANVDGSNAGDNTESQYFLTFGSIFGGGAGQIPAGATILEASLRVTTGSATNDNSGGYFLFSGMRTSYTSGTSITQFGTGTGAPGTNGPTYANGNATIGYGSLRAPALNTAYAIPLGPGLVQQWADGTLANNGFVVQAQTTDAWVLGGIANATVANRPQLAVTYTAQPTTTASLKQGVGGYQGLTAVTMNGVSGLTTDATAASTIALDGPTGGTPPGDAGSPDLLGFLKFDGVVGSAADQVPVRASIAKSWLVLTTGNGSNDQSAGPYSVHRMLTAWGGTTTYASFGTGSSGPVAGTDYVAAATGTANAMSQNAQAWIDVTSAVAAWQGGAANNGLLVKAATTDGWVVGGGGNSDAGRRPDLRTAYVIDSLVWTGASSTTWNKGSAVGVGGTPNWQLQTAGTATNFIDTDRVVFNANATGEGSVAVVIAAAVAPQRTTIDVASRGYTFTGSGRITGAGLLEKTGTGLAVLATDNDFTGGTTVSAGTLQLGDGGATGSLAGRIAVASGATLAFNRTGSVTMTGAVTGSGAIVKAGAGRVALSAPIAFAGPVSVAAGTLVLGSGSSGVGGVTVANGATFAASSGATATTFTTPTLALGAAGSTLGFELAAASNPAVPLLSVTQADGLTLGGGGQTISLASTGALGVGRFTLVDYAGAGISSGFTLAPLPQRLTGTLVYDTTATTIDLDITGVDTLRWKGGSSTTWDTGAAVDVGGAFDWVLASTGTTVTNFYTGDQVGFDDSASSGTVSIVGVVAPGAIAASNATLDYTLGGPGSIGGSGVFTKSGTGRMTLLVSNSSSGGTLVSAGTLQLGDASTAVNVAGNVSVAGGLLDVRNSRLAGTLGVSAGTATFTSGTVAGLVTVSGGTASFGAGTFESGATITAGRLGIGDGGLAGNVSVADGGTLAFVNTGTITYGGVLSGSGAIAKSGAGRVTFTASSNSFIGALTIDGGEVRIDDQGLGGDFGATAIVVNDGGTFQFGNATLGNPDLPNTTYITANTGGLVVWQEPEDFGGMHLQGALVDLQQGGMNFSGTTATSGWTSGTLTGATYAIGGTGPIVKTTAGEVLVTGSASITTTGGIAIREGTMRFASALNLGSGSVTLGADGTSGTYRYDGATASRSGAFTLGGVGGIAVTDAAAVLTLPTGLTGTGSLVKTGLGTLLLSGSGNFTGGTTIASGSLTAGVPRALGTGNVLVGNGGFLTVATTLDLGGFAVTTEPGGSVSVASGGSLPLAAGSSLAGFRSASAATSASILSGSVAAGGGTVSMTWLPTQSGLFSDVLELTSATGTTPFVLSMTYASGLDAGTAATLALGWNASSGTAANWVNATLGNTGNNAIPAQQGYLGSFTDFQTQYGGDLSAYVGAYGRDPSANSTWAVVNHNSQFVIVPEPGITAILAIAAVAAWAGRRLRRAAAAAALAALLAGSTAEAQTTVTFQQGATLTGTSTTYAGITEASIGNASATSTVTTVGIDGVSSGDGTERQFFLKYESIFGSTAGLIPAGATILDAQLTLRTTGNSNSQSAGTFVIGGMKVPFSAAATLNDLGTGNGTIMTNGPTYANGLATLPLAGYRAPAQNTFYSAFVAPLVQQWADGTLANNGMVVQAHTTDAWQVFGSADATVAYRPKLSVTYTTTPTITTSIKPGVAGYAGFSGITLHGLTNATLDVTAGTTITLDGPTGGNPPGDAGSPDLLAIVKYDGIFGSGAGQVPLRAAVLKSWFVPTTGNASNDESGGPYYAYRMLSSWGGTTTYSAYGTGSSGPVSGIDYVAVTSGSAVALGKNAQGWFDITSTVNDWKAGAANNGLLLRAATTDGWVFGGPTASDANRRPDLRVTYTLDSLVWKGNASSTWDRGSAVGSGGTQNWLLQTGGSATNFIDTDRVVFNDSAAGSGPIAVTIAEAVSPQRVTLDVGSRSQSFTGAGRITGGGSLVKSGTGTATLATDNDFTGGTAITAGTLRIGAGGTAGGIAGPIAVDGGAILEFNRAGRLTVAGALSGSGALRNVGPGRVDLIGGHAFSGPITVSSGTLGLSPFAAPAVTVANGASFAVVNTGSETTLTLPTLTLGAGASGLRFDLASAGNPVVPLLSVTTADGLVTSGGAHTIAVQTTGALQAGRFTLVNYEGAPISSGFSLAALPARLAGTLVYDTTNTSIDLDITGVDSVRWVGDLSTTWDAGTAADVGGTRNWELASSSLGTNFVTGDQVIFDDSSVVGSVALAGDVAPGSILVDNAAVAYSFGGTGAITGGGVLRKQGAGSLALLVSNSSSGAMTVAGGTLQAGDGSTAVTIAAPLAVSGSGGFTLRNGSIAGGITVTGGSATIASGSLASIATVSGGVLSIGAGGPAPALTGGLVVNPAGTIRFDQADGLVFGGSISGSGAIVQSGSGRTTFTASNNGFTGSVTINAGEVRIEDPGAGGDLAPTAIVVNNGGTFQFGNNQIGNPDLPTTTFITANAGGRVVWQEGEDLGGVHLLGGEIDVQQGSITSSGTPTVQIWTSGRLTGSGTQGFVVGGAAAIVKSTAGVVTVDGSASITSTGGLTVEDGTLRIVAAANVGSGPLTLGGASTAGTLVYDGGSALRSGSVTLAAGGGTVDVTNPAAVLSISGAVAGGGPIAKAGAGTLLFTGGNAMEGPFTVLSGTLGSTPYAGVAGGSVAAGAAFAVVNQAATTTLSLPSLSLGVGSKLGFTLAEPGIPAVPLMSVTTPGGLTLSGSVAVSLASSQSLGVGRFTLLEYDGAAVPSSFTLGTLPPRVLATLVHDTANTRLDLDVLGTGQLRWRGNASTVWDTGSAVDVGGAINWIDTSTSQATNFVVGDRIAFDDTAIGTAVTVDEFVTPAEITFNNSAAEYTITGSGAIASGGITKTGTGRVTLAVAKTGTQATTISAGTLRIGTGLASGSFAGPVSVASGATFDVANGVATGRVTVSGGLVTVTGSLAGGASVDAGELRIGDGGTAGGLAGNVAVAAGATATFNRGDALTYSGTLSGAGTVVKAGPGLFTILASSTGFTGTVMVNGGELALEDRGQGGDLNATSIVINDGGRFTFGAPGNADFPQSTNVTINAGGLFDLQQGENWGGLILDGGTLRMSGTRTGVNTNLDRMDLRSGRVETAFTGAGSGGQLIRLATSQFLQKTTSGTVTFGPGVVLQADLPVNLENGTIDFDVSALPASGNGAFTIGDAGNAVTLRVSGIGTGTFGRYAYIGNPSLTVDVVDAGTLVAVTGTVEGGGAVIKSGSGTLDLRQSTGLTNATTVSGGTLRVSHAAALGTSEVVVRSAGMLDVAGGVTMRSPKVTVDGGTLRAGTLAVDSSTGVARVEVRGAGTIAGSPAVSVGAGGSLILSSSAATMHSLASLAVDEAAGLLDLGAGGFAIAVGGIRQADLLADLVAGRGDGSWNGTHGITSSAAVTALGQSIPRTLGWLDNGDGAMSVAFSAPGDTNLDWTVDILDAANFLAGGKFDSGTPANWNEGDFGYDGVVDILDAADFLSTGLFDAGLFNPAPQAAAVAAVPEPSATAMLAVAGAVLAWCRARRIWLPVRDGHGTRGGLS
ncbi:MAG: DNRLRE domain-containing protein [Planctomycetes bacterium]|nr:DNRLRE domain-containing protein [Planctomycetota bacterium]